LTSAALPILGGALPEGGAQADGVSGREAFAAELLGVAAEGAPAPAAPVQPQEPSDEDMEPAEVPDQAVALVAAPVEVPGDGAPAAAEGLELAGAQARVEAPEAQPAPDAQRMFEVEELPAPEPLPETPRQALESALSDLAGEGEGDGPDSPLPKAAQGADPTAPEWDGLLEPEGVAEAEVQAEPEVELPTPDLTRLRVQVDDDLAVEVGREGGRLDVAIDGTAQALEDLEDMGPELAASLEQMGFSLGSFSQEERQEAPEGGAGAGEVDGAAQATRGPRKPSGGRLVNRLA